MMKLSVTILSLVCTTLLLSRANAVSRLESLQQSLSSAQPEETEELRYPHQVEATWPSVLEHTVRLMSALPPYMRYESYYWPVQFAYIWYDGYEMETKWKNSTACIDAASNYTFVEKERAQQLKKQSNSSFEVWSLRGERAANFSKYYWTCSSAFWTFSEYWNERFQPYRETPEFSPVGVFFLSLANNLPGQLFSITNIYNSIVNNLNASPVNTLGIQYDIARLVKILTIFEMVDFEEGSLNVAALRSKGAPVGSSQPKGQSSWDFWSWLADQTIIPMTQDQVDNFQNIVGMTTNYVNAGRGFFNATGFIFGGNKTECQFSFQVGLSSAFGSVTQFMDNMTYFGTLNAVNGLAEIPVQFNRSVSSCHYSVLEIKEITKLYAGTFSNFGNFGFNLFMNTG